MGQKTNPIGNRLGIIKGWESNWYGGRNFADNVVEDEKIRIYLNARIQDLVSLLVKVVMKWIVSRKN